RSARPRGGSERQAGLAPCGDPAVEYRDIGDTGQSQHPPQARCGERTARVVVRDDADPGLPAPLRQRRRERVIVRQRVTTESVLREIGKIAVEIGMDRASDMCLRM